VVPFRKSVSEAVHHEIAQRDERLVKAAIGPSVWTGRALQAKNDDLEVIGLAHLYPALERKFCVPGHHGYPRALDLIRDSAPEGQIGYLITNALARPLHLRIFDSQTSAEKPALALGSAKTVPRSHRRRLAPIWRATGATGIGGYPLGEAERVHQAAALVTRAS
jgi:hypothetical protein